MMLLLVSKLPAKSIYHSSVPLAPTRIKKKNPALRAEKTRLACEYINGNDNGNYSHLVLRMVFPLESGVFLFVGLQPCKGVGIMKSLSGSVLTSRAMHNTNNTPL